MLHSDLNIVLHLYNTRPHITCLTKQKHWKTFDPTPYSQNLSTSDFIHFDLLKQVLGRGNFHQIKESKNFYANDFIHILFLFIIQEYKKKIRVCWKSMQIPNMLEKYVDVKRSYTILVNNICAMFAHIIAFFK